MQNRWKDEEAKAAIDRWGDALGEAVALRLYTAKLIGCEPDLVLHGGGNVSVKCKVRTLLSEDVEAVRVKSSGADMSCLTPSELPVLDLPYLRRLGKLDRLTDEEMVNAFRTHLFDAGAPTPSIETLLHVFLPHRFVDHSHADAILAMTNQPNGESLIRDVLGERVAVLPYVRPGFELAKAAADAIDQSPQVEGLVLLQHGLVTFA
ncbi:MAG: class II aldolase/adducin family protein, partial [Planctomycetes bacterium]|nr:class II aldolase/adducin family protein [Planctomycetota bacterium]